jgi:stearoyl-CoA desaturase (Delta-9 desaturase)
MTTVGEQDCKSYGEGGDILYPNVALYLLVHAAGLAAIWTGVTPQAATICVALYVLRMFAICAGYHRYFSHRSYATSRIFQFVLAFFSQSSAQKSVLWWAAMHRHHHLHSDTERDLHSPRHKGFWHAHIGWIFDRHSHTADLTKVADLTRYPELTWLHRFALLPAVVLAVLTFLFAGWSGLVVGFFWSTILTYHATFCINSVAHEHGSRRYVTGDESRNNWILAVFTLGEGWHNNHHACPSSARQGFRWLEFDPTYYLLLGLRRVGIVWDLKTPPEAVLQNEQRLGLRTIDRAAAQLATMFNAESIASTLIFALEATKLAELREMLAAAKDNAADVLGAISLPHLPTREDVCRRAVMTFAKTRSLEDIIARAYPMILNAVVAHLAIAR